MTSNTTTLRARLQQIQQQRGVRPKANDVREETPTFDWSNRKDRGPSSSSKSDLERKRLFQSHMQSPQPLYEDASQGHLQQTHEACTKLRQLVRRNLDRNHVLAAQFYADKLLTLAVGNAQDVLLFAQTCFLNNEHHRAIHILKTSELVLIEDAAAIQEVNLQGILLLSQCMLAVKQRDECLDLLTRTLPNDQNAILRFAKRFEHDGDDEQHGQDINLVASLALLMGQAYEATGNRDNAALYFRIALQCDVYCSEAFFHLFEKQMLSASEEKQLLESMNFSSDKMDLLQLLYRTHVGKYDATPSINVKFAEVEDTIGLKENLDLNITKAETYYHQHDIQRAHEICEWVCERDPYNSKVATVYVATMVELRKKRELYHYAHQMVDVYPKKAVAWYAVGCYYLLVHKYEAAQRYFHKATTLEPSYAAAWIGFGNSFAAQDESDQAMSSYRTASSLFPGCHLPPLFIGMEHLRTNNLVQALEFIKQAGAICPSDPLVYNELGTVYYKQKNYPMAIEMFTKTLGMCEHLPERLMEAWEPTLFNLAYSYRKLRKFDQAIFYFQSALRLSPKNASILAALGFTYHMQGNLEQAIESYHAALAYDPEETLAGEMITVAFEESLSSSAFSFAPTPTPAPAPAPAPATASWRQDTSSFVSQSPFTPDRQIQRTLRLDQSYSSVERSRQSIGCSSLDLSDDSAMAMEE